MHPYLVPLLSVLWNACPWISLVPFFNVYYYIFGLLFLVYAVCPHSLLRQKILEVLTHSVKKHFLLRWSSTAFRRCTLVHLLCGVMNSCITFSLSTTFIVLKTLLILLFRLRSLNSSWGAAPHPRSFLMPFSLPSLILLYWLEWNTVLRTWLLKGFMYVQNAALYSSQHPFDDLFNNSSRIHGIFKCYNHKFFFCS